MMRNPRESTLRPGKAWLGPASVFSASLALLGVVACAATTGCGSDGSNYDSHPSPDAPEYTVEFYVQSAGRFGALQLEIRHLGNSGSFIGDGDKVDCVALVEAIVASNYLGENLTKVGMISLAGVATPSAIMRCGFRTSEDLTPADFRVDVPDASDTSSNPLDPVPTVVVSTIIPR